MGSAYVSPMCHGGYHTQGIRLKPMPSLQKIILPIGAKIAANHAELPGLATRPLISKLPSSDPQFQCLACFAPRAAPVDTPQLSSISAPSSSDPGSKAPLVLSKEWRQIQGEKYWEGLLNHPIDATLRAEIIRYGEFAQVCYDAFDFNEHSAYCGSCKYSPKSLFEKVDRGGCGYEVTKYLCATSNVDLPKFFKKSDREQERWSQDSNWMGYVAVCTDEDEIRRIGRRDILIAWRGTVTTTEWIDDMMTSQVPATIELAAASGSGSTATALPPLQSNKNVKVESGFLSLYTSSKPSSKFNKLSVGQQMAREVKRLLQKYEGEELSISTTGHSLGAALAILCAYDIAANIVPSLSSAVLPKTAPPTSLTDNLGAAAAKSGQPTIDAAKPVAGAGSSSWLSQAAVQFLAAGTPSKHEAVPPEFGSSLPITVFTFGGPRVGNKAFKRRLEGLGVRVLRIVNVHDSVPKVPGVFFNEHVPEILPNIGYYYHVGKELVIDFDLSPHLRKTRDLPSHHNLEAHLHVMDGFQGLIHPFQSVFGRDPHLVNKSSDFLHEDIFIPSSWWQDYNKGLVKDPLSGRWVLASREEEHLPENHHSELSDEDS